MESSTLTYSAVGLLASFLRFRISKTRSAAKDGQCDAAGEQSSAKVDARDGSEPVQSDKTEVLRIWNVSSQRACSPIIRQP